MLVKGALRRWEPKSLNNGAIISWPQVSLWIVSERAGLRGRGPTGKHTIKTRNETEHKVQLKV